MNFTGTIALPAAVAAFAEAEAPAILQDVEGIQAVVIATVDGFEIAASIRNNLEAARISALASSIAAIGDVVSIEAQLGNTKSVTVDTSSGVAMIFTVRRDDMNIVIIVIADSRALYGQIAYRTAAAARAMAAIP